MFEHPAPDAVNGALWLRIRIADPVRMPAASTAGEIEASTAGDIEASTAGDLLLMRSLAP